MPIETQLLAAVGSPVIQQECAARRWKAAGFTLLECLVAMALGLGVVSMALTAWQSSQQTWQAVMAQQNLQHNARAALDAIARQADLTGGEDAHGVVTPPKVFATDQPQGGDTLQLSHPRSVDASDCQGNRHGTQAWVQSQFQRSSTTPNDFACKDLLGPDSTFQALAEGVEDFQVMLAETSTDRQTLQWKTPSAVRDWANVVAVEVCLRLASPTLHGAATATVTGCQGEALKGDGHLQGVVRRVMRVQRWRPFHA
jgi:prepilin-type N-terminal cleavage/methylation domain-containing protein